MRVYFNLRKGSRERMWETAKEAQKVVEVIIPPIPKSNSSNIFQRNHFSITGKIIGRLKGEIGRFLINRQKIKAIEKKIDLLYMWGSFPINSPSPFIIELDNPYCLTYYHRNSFLKRRAKIGKELLKAKKIHFLSETARLHLFRLLEGLPQQETLKKRAVVFYPFVDANYKKVKKRQKSPITFLFIGLGYKRKGGRELLKAFQRVKGKNLRLIFISDITPAEREQYRDSRIEFFPPLSRRQLLERIYPQADVLLFPTFYESFGMVALEALSFGLGIIATNLYAMPEIVEDGVNGKLLHHPIIPPEKWNGKWIVNPVDITVQQFYHRYLSNGEFYYSLYRELKEGIEMATDLLEEWQGRAIERFQKRFSPTKWLETFQKSILEE